MCVGGRLSVIIFERLEGLEGLEGRIVFVVACCDCGVVPLVQVVL